MAFDLITLAPAAFLAGVLMFLAPCTLPIVPGYLAFISGSTERGRMVKNAIAFVIGFSVIFILLGTFAAAAGQLLGPWREGLARAAGVLIIFFGLMMLGLVRIPALTAERRARIPKFLSLGRPESSALIGALFAIGWSPCIGPILGSILFIASVSATALQGAFLLSVFSLGLGIPFILCAIFLEKASVWFVRAGKVTTTLSYIGGAVLVAIGVLMLTGNLGLLITWGFGIFDFAGYQSLLKYL